MPASWIAVPVSGLGGPPMPILHDVPGKSFMPALGSAVMCAYSYSLNGLAVRSST